MEHIITSIKGPVLALASKICCEAGRYNIFQCCVSSHLIHAIRNGESFLIGNNHGHMNGWVSKNKIYGKVAEIL